MTDIAELLPPPAGIARRRRRWIATGTVVVILAVVIPTGMWFVHWRSSLHPFVAYPMYGESTRLTAGRTEYFGTNAVAQRVIDQPKHPGELSLHIDSVRLVVPENSAGAVISVLRCALANDGPGPDGDGRAATAATCAVLQRFSSGPVTLGFKKRDDDIVVAVTPHHAGRVRINGMYVRFSAGLRHGSQHIGAQIGTRTV